MKLLVLVLVAIGLGLAAPRIVHAQPAQPTVDVITHVNPPTANVYPHNDIVESHGKGMALLFWAFAVASIVGALFVVTRRNLIVAVIGMVGSFIGIAAVYMMLYAQFLAVIQMLVYAGAIMVLFVFVIMILNRPEDEPVAPTGRAGQILGGLAIVYLVARLVSVLTNVVPPAVTTDRHDPIAAEHADRLRADAAPASITLAGYGSPDHPTPPEAVGWGTVKAVGNDLFGQGLFPFEAISILLLLAVVGAIAIARPLHPHDGTDADPGTHP